MLPWHLHPIFVHFSFSLLFVSSLLFIIAALGRGRGWTEKCLTVARWNFWIGILMAAFTAVTGLIAYFTVPGVNDVLRMEINKHLIAAVVTVIVYLTLAFFLWRSQQKNVAPSNRWTTVLVLGLVLLCLTGYLGGRLVFNHGVGVNIVVVD